MGEQPNRQPTDKQRAFVTAYIASGRNASEAYRQAYKPAPETSPKTIVDNGRKILRSPVVKRLLVQATAEAEAVAAQVRKELAVDYGVREALEEAHATYVQAMQSGQHSAAVSALTLKAKLLGLVVDRKETTTRQLTDISRSDLAAAMQDLQSKLSQMGLPSDLIDVTPTPAVDSPRSLPKPEQD